MAKRTVHVNKGQISPRVHHTLANDQTKTTSTASDQTDFAIEREAGQSWLHILTTSAVDGLTAGQLVLLGILNLDLRVSS
jgi:hypothetical protein